jgi:aspartyl-tRNA(Asn)/glutamyl-tRNA(Gln) amidotransferase subunit C
MAKVTIDIAHLANLARVNLTEDEAARFGGELERVLGYVDQLQNIETGGVAETAQVTGLVNVLREDNDERLAISDKQLEGLQKRREKFLAAVPEKEQNMVKVPAILGSE